MDVLKKLLQLMMISNREIRKECCFKLFDFK